MRLRLLTWLLMPLAATGAELAVPGQYATIQAAINAAVAGDIVRVAPGTYTENLTLRTGIDVRGVEAARTLLEPEADGATVAINGRSDIIFANFTLINATFGITVTDSTEITLASTVIDGATTSGITVDAVSGVEIVNNVFFANQRALLRGSIDVPIVNNIFAGNATTVLTGSVDFPILDEANIEFNCFFDNDDLALGGVDTALGTDFQIGNPDFVDSAARDFHLTVDSPCIDAGTGTDIIDNSVADLGAYGGDYADVRPYPVPQPTASDTSTTTPESFNIRLSWEANESYLVTNTATPGRYKVYYDQDAPGPPYDGTDAAGGTSASPIDVGNVTSFTLADLAPAAPVPAAPELLSAAPANQSVTLSWQAVSGATGYRVSYGVAAVDENLVDVGDVTRASITGLDNDASYRFAVAALAQPTYYLAVTAVDNTPAANESVRSEEAAIRIGPVLAGALSNELTAVPAEVTPFPDLEDEGGCFIATAAYGADLAPEVLALREFRDRWLLTHAPGRAFVHWYYTYGPAAARLLDAHAPLKPLVRAVLWPAVGMALVVNASAPLLKSAMVILLLTGTGLRWRRRSLVGEVRA